MYAWLCISVHCGDIEFEDETRNKLLHYACTLVVVQET